MPTIKILPHPEYCPQGAEITAPAGTSICEALLDNHINIEHACEMSCACTTCHVIVREGFNSLNEAEEGEEDLLDRAWGLEPQSRLSCQAILAQDDCDDRDSEVLDQPRQGKPLMSRQIVLDTETTGLSAENGDRIIELGCVELFNRKLTGNDLHIYFNPERESHEDALKVHGLTTDFLRDKPKFATLAQRHRRVPARCRADHPQRGLRRRLPQQGIRARRPAAAAQLRRRSDRHAGHGQGGLPGQAQFARCAVRPLRRRPLEPHLPRRQARRAAAGRRLHQPHARPGCAADRRRCRTSRRRARPWWRST